MKIHKYIYQKLLKSTCEQKRRENVFIVYSTNIGLCIFTTSYILWEE